MPSPEVEFDSRFDTAHRGRSLGFDPNDFQSAEADKNLVVKFYMDAVENVERSAAESRLICDEVEFIEIRVRGDRNNIIQRPARKDDKSRFRDAYRAFQANEEVGQSGTLLKDWPLMTKSSVQELNYLGFHTVEQLSQASDGVCSKFAGLQSFKQKAKLYLEHAAGISPIEKLSSELAAERNEKEVMQRNMAEMAAQIKNLQEQANRKAK